tara:strand:+ start:9054 stop:9599 length:546 start_codon:yes stop_codon:yes gene_type:complete
VAQELMQTGGYNAFSFNHIAERVGIKKPSIIHHYPTKEALGKAVVQRYRETFDAALQSIGNDPDKTALQAFEFYCTPYTDFGATNDKVCLCGALAGEFMALPDDVKKEVTQFFEDHIRWLEGILKRGKNGGEFSFSEKPNILAKLILDSLQGALIVKRATGDGDQVHQIITALKSRLADRY